MKKLIVLCATALLVTACAKVDGKKTNQYRGPVAPFGVNQPINNRPIQQNPQQMQPNSGVAVAPISNAPATVACVANVIREIRIVHVEKFERKSKSKIVTSGDSFVVSKVETAIKLASGKVLSRVKTDGMKTEKEETLDFKAQTIQSDDTKVRFSLNKVLSEKNKKDVYSMNQADLTSSIYASVDEEASRMSEKGYEKACSYLATGRFSLKGQTVESRVFLTEAYQLDQVALRSLIRKLNRK